MTFPAEQRCDLPFTPELMREVLLRTAHMPGADLRDLTSYVTAVPIGQTIRETAKAVAETVKLSPPSTSTSIRRLLIEGWLEVAYRVGTVNFYRAGHKVTDLAGAEEHEDQPLATVSHLPLAGRVDE